MSIGASFIEYNERVENPSSPRHKTRDAKDLKADRDAFYKAKAERKAKSK